MEFAKIITDLAIESAENVQLASVCRTDEIGFEIKKHSLNIKTKAMSERIGKPIGVYTTFDCTQKIYSSAKYAKGIESNLSSSIKNLIGNIRRTSPVLVACLGNGNIAADSLGQKVFDKIDVSRKKNTDSEFKHTVCALSTSVLGKTGIESAEILSAVSKEIKPAFVVLVDSLATSVPARVGLSFQLSTAGITPGSGVGGDKEKIDKTVTGSPVLSIGVPMLLSLNTLVYGMFKDFATISNCELDEFKFRNLLCEKRMSNMVVAPKDVDVLSENASVIIAGALNMAFN